MSSDHQQMRALLLLQRQALYRAMRATTSEYDRERLNDVSLMLDDLYELHSAWQTQVWVSAEQVYAELIKRHTACVRTGNDARRTKILRMLNDMGSEWPDDIAAWHTNFLLRANQPEPTEH